MQVRRDRRTPRGRQGPIRLEGGAGADADSLEQHLRGGRKRAATEDVEVRKRPAEAQAGERRGAPRGRPRTQRRGPRERRLWGAATDLGSAGRARAIASTRMCPCMAQ